MVCFNGIKDDVLVVEGFFVILNNVAKVSVQNFWDVILLIADTAG